LRNFMVPEIGNSYEHSQDDRLYIKKCSDPHPVLLNTIPIPKLRGTNVTDDYVARQKFQLASAYAGDYHEGAAPPASRRSKKLFSEDIPEMRTAEGRWFEAIIYEMILDLSLQTDLIRAVVARGADGPARVRRAQLGQNGLFYSNIGDIKVRGNGQDLAEVDLMLVDHTGALTFGEIITSPADLKELEEEIHYKKQLLGYLYGQPTVPFLLISSVDISRTAVVRRLLKEPDNILLTTATCEDLKTLIQPRDLRRSPPGRSDTRN